MLSKRRRDMLPRTLSHTISCERHRVNRRPLYSARRRPIPNKTNPLPLRANVDAAGHSPTSLAIHPGRRRYHDYFPSLSFNNLLHTAANRL